MNISSHIDNKIEYRSRSNAFVIEAVILLLLLVVVTTFFFQINLISERKSSEAMKETIALEIASNIAERFSADPLVIIQEYENGKEENDYIVRIDHTAEQNQIGILYTIDIVVSQDNKDYAQLHTTKYERE